MNWTIPAGVAAVAAIFLVSSKAEAATPPADTGPGTSPITTGQVVPGGPLWSAFSATQQQWMRMIITEAKKQGVPVELALATGHLESTFANVKAANGASYGPMQVHTSNLKDGETVADLQNPAFSIARGVSILRKNLVKAKGDTKQARLYYFCGPNYTDTKCKPATRAAVLERFAVFTAKWKVKAVYAI